MDTRNGTIYDSREAAELAGVLDADLVTGSREALDKLRQKLVFTKGSFKPVPQETAQMANDDESKDETTGLGEATEIAEAPEPPAPSSQADGAADNDGA
jgi:hypothetical protein